jgi:hypothetical protein
MNIEISLYGTKQICEHIFNRYLDPFLEIRNIKPRNDLLPRPLLGNSHSMYGSLLPRMANIFDLSDRPEFATNTVAPKEVLSDFEHSISPYLDSTIGLGSRASDVSNIECYPYLNQEHHNYELVLRFFSDYANEDFIKLIYAQLKNYNSEHCYLAQIKAYCAISDICYHAIDIKNTIGMTKDADLEKGTVCMAWHGSVEIGYHHESLEIDFEEAKELFGEDFTKDQIISPLQLKPFLENENIDSEVASSAEFTYALDWITPPYPESMRSIAFLNRGLKYSYRERENSAPVFIDFKWE